MEEAEFLGDEISCLKKIKLHVHHSTKEGITK